MVVKHVVPTSRLTKLINPVYPPGPLVVRVQDADWGGADHSNIRAVLVSAANTIWRNFSGKRLEPIEVGRSHRSPITLFMRGPNGEYYVRLNTSSTFWAQYAYQFAHEFCHIVCRYRKGENPNRWFEESLCELASIYALRQMARDWKTNPPYRNWRGFAVKLNDYADDVIKKGSRPASESLATWYAQNKASLRASAENRELNRVVAVQMLPLIEANPEHWNAVWHLNDEEHDASASLQTYLRNWHDNTPDRHKSFVKAIAELFEVSIENE